ncbi:MAG: proline--tRNA ligase, partial [Actinobacteria bacterium]|nr:proline--tRNA ligase [Actinomycetota bacterium]
DDAPFEAAELLGGQLEAAGVRVLYDDRRAVSPGIKFNDSELIGVPTIVVVGKRLVEGFIEVKDRRTGERTDIAMADAVSALLAVCEQ